jgi:hypothetical protein
MQKTGLMARTRRDPSEPYADLTRELGAPVYERIDAPATAEEKAVLLDLSPGDISASELAGHPIQAMLTMEPDNGAPIDGLRVVTAHVVCGASVRHGRRLQALRGELSWERPLAAHPGGSASDHQQGIGGSHGMRTGGVCRSSGSF